MKIASLQGACGSTLGFMFSCIFMDNMNALIFMNMYLGVLYFSSGSFANKPQGENWLLDFLSPTSPFTYVCEEMMRTLLSGLDYANTFCEYFNMKRGSEDCIESIIKITVTYFVIAWVFTVVKSKILF